MIEGSRSGAGSGFGSGSATLQISDDDVFFLENERRFFTHNLNIRTTQNFYAELEIVRKNVINLMPKSYTQKKWAKLEFVLFHTNNLHKFFGKHLFLGALFSNYFLNFESA